MNHLKQLSTKNWLSNSTSSLNPALITLKTQVFTVRFIRNTILVALAYILLTSFINDFAIYRNITSLDFSPLLKTQVTWLMFVKNLTIFGPIHLITLVGISLLVGLNVVIVTRKISAVRAQRNTQWTFGAGLFSFASAGCPGCGFSILSITGLTPATLTGFTLENPIYVTVTISILLATSVYNLSSLAKSSCAMK